MAIALRMTSTAFSGPIEMATTWPSLAAATCRAASTP